METMMNNSRLYHSPGHGPIVSQLLSDHMSSSEPRAEQDIFDDLAELCTKPGFVHALAWMSLRDNYVAFNGIMDSDALAASYVPGRTVRTEFSTLLGLLIRQQIDLTEPEPTEIQALLDRTNALLEELHARLGRPMWNSIIETAQSVQESRSEHPPSPFTRADVLREPIFYGSESAYSFQYEDMALERYTEDEAWLLANKGFSINDAQIVARAISEIQNIKIPDILSQQDTKKQQNPPLLSAFTITMDEIVKNCNKSPAIVKSVLSAISVLAPSNKDFTSLSAFNIASACPIIAISDENYIALQTYGIAESLYDSPFYWMISDTNYRAKASTHRGAFTERFVAKRLRSVFGKQNVHCNVNIEGASERVSEIDALVLFGDRALIIQCKSKKMTLESRKGNDQALRDDFQKAVQESYNQGLLCAKMLHKSGLKFFDENTIELKIPKLRNIYIICVVSDHYPALTVQARNFLHYKKDQTIDAPLVSDVFLIDVLAEMLSSPLRFLSYIDRRVGYADRIHGTNELAILGYHLNQNLWFEDETSIAIISDEFSLDLDAAMTVRREKIPGIAIPEGILTKFSNTHFEYLINKIERESHPDLIDLGFLLLDINGDTVKTLDHEMKDVARRTRLDGRPHDFSLGFNMEEAGITIHCNPTLMPAPVKALTDHCQRRKYVHHASNWFGLLVREADGLPELTLAVRFPWKRDIHMDYLTQGMTIIKSDQTKHQNYADHTPERQKIGRNDSCPCGSGRKYKKCCLFLNI